MDTNEYRLERHRYLELKHFCRQYPIWKSALLAGTNDLRYSERDKRRYEKYVTIVEQAAHAANPEIYGYILCAASEGFTFEVLKEKYTFQCSREEWYNAYRKFFWLLDKVRD